ncbi:MAG TPA: MFS transporter [Acidimicrobiales bacterium]|nr:MFS transporter [Acidimicrobiales bacterium]
MRRGRIRVSLPPGFGTIWTAVAVDLIGFGIVLPILPIYARRYHTTSFEATLLVAAYSAATFVASPIWGRLSDRIGRKPVLLVSLVGTAAGSLITGLAGGMALLFVGRIVDGASGASISVAQAAAADLSRPSERSRLFGLLGAAFGLGFVAGPAIGALAALGGPRLPFFVAAGLAAANAVVAWRRLPETRPPDRRAGGPRPGPIAALMGARGAAALIAVAFSAMVAFSGFEATFAIFGQKRLGFDIASAAAVFTAVGALIVVVQGGLVHPLVSRLGEVRTLLVGLGANTAGLTLLAFSHSWSLAAPALVALTTGQGLVQTTMATALVSRSDPSSRGQILGAQQSASALARVLGPALLGALLGADASGAPYLVGAALTALAAGLVGVALRGPERHEPQQLDLGAE